MGNARPCWLGRRGPRGGVVSVPGMQEGAPCRGRGLVRTETQRKGLNPVLAGAMGPCLHTPNTPLGRCRGITSKAVKSSILWPVLLVRNFSQVLTVSADPHSHSDHRWHFSGACSGPTHFLFSTSLKRTLAVLRGARRRREVRPEPRARGSWHHGLASDCSGKRALQGSWLVSAPGCMPPGPAPT